MALLYGVIRENRGIAVLFFSRAKTVNSCIEAGVVFTGIFHVLSHPRFLLHEGENPDGFVFFLFISAHGKGNRQHFKIIVNASKNNTLRIYWHIIMLVFDTTKSLYSLWGVAIMDNNNDGKQNPETTSMDQVRELLFGAQLKDMETRFQRQEARFQREISDAREALKNRLDSLENFMRSETASLMHRINTETSERDAALKVEEKERIEAFNNLTKSIAAAEEAFERRVAALSSTLDNTEQEIRKLMLTETGNMNNKIDEKYENALRVISETASQIRHDMVYRSSLSSMFTEMVVKLSGQWSSDVARMMGDESSSHSHENIVEHSLNDEGRSDA